MTSLIELLCFHFECKPIELHGHVLSIERRLRGRKFRTLHGAGKIVTCGGITFQGASDLKAFNGKHGVNVTQYYFARHKKDLDHPSLPCVIEYAGRGHRNYYPLECLAPVM
ncbi:hypothetical protein AAVH_26095 [Aphelenchoides avenae]|nr:hypothetical protein AAVH_26095 [Aphelenchus avenae]